MHVFPRKFLLFSGRPARRHAGGSALTPVSIIRRPPAADSQNRYKTAKNLFSRPRHSIPDGSGWARVRYGDKGGYCSTDYLIVS